MVLVAHFHFELHQMDVKSAFLNTSFLKKFMSQPEGFEIKGKDYIIYRLKKPLYRLKQASRQWFLRFDEVVTSFSFKGNVASQCGLSQDQ